MRTLTDRISVAANATSTNRLGTKLGEFLERNSALRLTAVAAAVGLFITLIVGGETVIDDQEISGANRFPVDPDDVVGTPGGLAGDQLILRLRNSTGAAIVGITQLQEIPV